MGIQSVGDHGKGSPDPAREAMSVFPSEHYPSFLLICLWEKNMFSKAVRVKGEHPAIATSLLPLWEILIS